MNLKWGLNSICNTFKQLPVKRVPPMCAKVIHTLAVSLGQWCALQEDAASKAKTNGSCKG
jgi:hypothetical protein